MKIGILSDIHSNLEALQVSFKLLHKEGIKEFICCGDLVGYGPNPNKCIELLRDNRVRCVKGNHDAAVLGQVDLGKLNNLGRQAVRWTRKKLTTENRSYLQHLPTSDQLQNHSISILHGSSTDPLWGYILRHRDAYLSFRMQEKDFHLQIFGHTHLPSVYAFQESNVRRENISEMERISLGTEKRYLINPGSVGQPRDEDWRTSLSILNLGNEDWVEFHRLEYEVEKTRQKILSTSLPMELGNRLLSGK